MSGYAAVSVDLDEIDCYLAIHGLSDSDELGDAARHAVYDRALPRLAALFDELGIAATFFVIGRDLERASNREAVASLARNGHELGNHTMQHRYDLVRQGRNSQLADVQAGAEAIEQACGTRPVGFRAPGYSMTDQLMDVLRESGVRYDSSVFPCPPYYFAKAAAMAGIALRGRESHSILGPASVLRAPIDPYRVGEHYHRPGEHGIVELPIGVTGMGTGYFPYIGTSVVMWGEGGARWLTRRMLGRPLVNLELHGIDLADAQEDGLLPLAKHQPDLRRSRAEKEAALRAALTTLRDAGYEFATLQTVATQFG